jgi:hypothetical protein
MLDQTRKPKTPIEQDLDEDKIDWGDAGEGPSASDSSQTPKFKGLSGDEIQVSANGHARKATIKLSPETYYDTINQIEDALLGAGVPIYQRAGRLVFPVLEMAAAAHGKTTSVAKMIEVTLPWLMGKIVQVAEFERFDRRNDEWLPANPPRDRAEIILARRDEWRAPRVSGVISTPILRCDGMIVDKSG